MQFLLGTHEVSWLARSPVPLFISAVRLRRRERKTLPRAVCDWGADSGGFSEISMHGKWTVTPRSYVAEVQRWTTEIGRLLWAAIQDWMCEPHIIAKTGLSVLEHQRRTIASYLELRDLAPEVTWVPVVQGWTVDDYRAHVDAYNDAGVDLRAFGTVGVGSVCRRQGTLEGARIITAITDLGIKVHAFGVKRDGLALFQDRIASADSLAWSYVARRRQIQLPGHTHKTCSNCYDFAQQWRAELVGRAENAVSTFRQTEMPWA